MSVTRAKAGTEQGALGRAAAKKLPEPHILAGTSQRCRVTDCKCICAAAKTQPGEEAGCQGSQEALTSPCPQAQGPLGKGTARGRPGAAHPLLDGHMLGSPVRHEKTPL